MTSAAASTAPPTPAGLRRVIRPTGFFVLSFGSIVGSGWVLVLGDWLKSAGPGGAVLGFVLGGLAIALICAAFAELATRSPQAGGEFLYALETLGPTAAFAVGWFLTLFYLSVCAFEGIALTVLVQLIFPGVGGPTLYSLLGHDITLGGVIIGASGAILIGFANYLGVQAAVLVQKAITYTFLAIAGALVLAGFTLGDVSNAAPLFASTTGASWIGGMLWIFALCAMFLSGFQASVHVIEERHPDTSARAVVIAMLLGLFAATAFYCLIILSASIAAPWQQSATSALPAADAYAALTAGGWLRSVVLFVATISLLKTWNATLLIAARLLFAQSRLGFLPQPLQGLHPKRQSPALAILIITAISVVAVFLGRGAVLPIVNMCGMAIAVNFTVMIYVLYRRRRIDPGVPAFVAPGGTPMLLLAGAVSAGMAIILIYEPSTRVGPGEVPVEWTLLAAWAVLGCLAAYASRRRRTAVPVNTLALPDIGEKATP